MTTTTPPSSLPQVESEEERRADLKTMKNRATGLLVGVALVAAHGPHHPAITEFSAAALAAEREVEASIEANIRSRLEQDVPTAQLKILGEGRPGEELSDLADTLDAQMIVVATRGRGLVRSATLGSVAHHLVTHANAPVLVVR